MKPALSQGWKLALVLAGLPFMVGTSQSPGDSAQTNDAPPWLQAPSNAAPASAPQDTVDQSALPASAPTPVIPTLSPAAQEVLKLAQSGLPDDVLTAYVSSAYARFSLGSDQIIYLNDLGVSATVIKAMIQRDNALEQMLPAETGAAPAPPGESPTPPDSGTPPPDSGTEPGTMPLDVPTDYTDDGTGPYDTNDVPPDYFYGWLAPYGNWIVITGCGRCWQPSVCLLNPNWRPYCTQGCWVYTPCGWFWRSYYSWGWAPFHYGRWLCDAHHGWVWRPGRIWGPGWVCWRRSANYCGWAPLPPQVRFSMTTGLTWLNNPGTANTGFGLQASLFTFVPIAHLADSIPERSVLPQSQVAAVFGQTMVASPVSVANGRVVNPGVDVAAVAAASHTQIRTIALRELPVSGVQTIPSRGMGATGAASANQGAAALGRPNAQLPATAGFRQAPTGSASAVTRPPPTTTPSGSEPASYPANSLILYGSQTTSVGAGDAAPEPHPLLPWWMQNQPAAPHIANTGNPTAAQWNNRAPATPAVQSAGAPRVEPNRPGGTPASQAQYRPTEQAPHYEAARSAPAAQPAAQPAANQAGAAAPQAPAVYAAPVGGGRAGR